jgi:hypothetical protein
MTWCRFKFVKIMVIRGDTIGKPIITSCIIDYILRIIRYVYIGIFSRISRQISIKIGTTHPWFKGQIACKRDIITKIGWGNLKSSQETLGQKNWKDYLSHT